MQLKHHDSRLLEVKTSPDGSFSGYGSVYGVEDDWADVVAPGCFTESLAEWQSKGAMPALLWQHRSSEPAGTYTAMSEDSKGLVVEGQLMLKTAVGAYAYECLRTKAVTGLSIGFMTRDDSYDQKTGVRTIRKADLWEVSIVTFPANDKARVDSVKSIPDFQSISEFEKWLRDTSTLSRTDAAAAVSKAKILFQSDSGFTKSSQAVLDALARQTEAMRPR